MYQSFYRSTYLWLLIFSHNAAAKIAYLYQLEVFNAETNTIVQYRLKSTVDTHQDNPNKIAFDYTLEESRGSGLWKDPPDYLKPLQTPILANIRYNSESTEDLIERIRLIVPNTIIPWSYTVVSFASELKSTKGFQHSFIYLSTPLRILFQFSTLLSHQAPPSTMDWTAVIRDNHELEHTLIVRDNKLHAAYGQLSQHPYLTYQLMPVNESSCKEIMRCQQKHQAKPINLFIALYRKLSSKFWLIANSGQ